MYIKFKCLTNEAHTQLLLNLSKYKLVHIWLGDALVTYNTDYRLWEGNKLWVGYNPTIELQQITDYDIQKLLESVQQ